MKSALLVDDDPEVLALLTRWLTGSQFRIITASTFADARTEIKVRAPDVVITDVRLGGYNGLQLAILARAVRPEVRLIIITGWDDEGLRRDAAGLDATIFRKPLRAEELLAAVGGSADP